MKKMLFIVLSVISFFSYSQNKTLTGFTKDASLKEVKLEEKFDSYLQAANLDHWMRRLSARPHHLGSAYGKSNAEFMRDLFRSWGYEAEIEIYQVLFPTPKTRLLEMTAPEIFKATLQETALKEDVYTQQKPEQLPTYNCWSADGDVTGQLVFVNYGIPDDYEQLERMGIEVKGKIVIAKYGGSYRGIKPKLAQEHGAIGCLIYSDPKNDGYFHGDVYPKGAFRNQQGVQRGMVIDLGIHPGDPLTQNVGATADARRIDRKDAVNLIKIPVQPISSGDAQPLLASLKGPVAPREWRGALPITYHVGPGLAKVHLKLEFDWKIVPCYNVIAKMKGSEFPDEWVIRGNHHDAWVNGAYDPVSGMVALLEEARTVGKLAMEGLKPKRTIIYCAWDGEEEGLIGSTEWVENHADELKQKAVACINTDANGRGFLTVEGSHTLEKLMDEVAQNVMDPQTGISIRERMKSLQASLATTAKAKKEILQKESLNIGALGSGTDHGAFIDHLAIPCLSMGFDGEDEGGEYHTIYDTYNHFKRFKDPAFEYGVALSKTAGRATLRLANAEVLPFDFKGFYRTVKGYLGEVITLLDNLRESTEVENQMIKENRYKQSSDPKEIFVQPSSQSQVPYLNFSNLQNAMAELEKSSTQFAELQVTNPKPNTNLIKLNQLLFQAEQKLITEKGLPRRPWYKHTIYAPGFYTGYEVKTLPGIREAIEQRNWEEAQEQIEIVAHALTEYSKQVDEAVKILMMR